MKESTLAAAEIEPEPLGDSKNQPPARGKMARKIVIFAVLILLIGLIVFGVRLIMGHGDEKIAGIPSVAVVKAVRMDLAEDVTLTAEFIPYQNVALHAKVSGYVKWISVDIGDRVKGGQVIAELEIPELQDEINKAAATIQAVEQDVKRAEADYNDAHLNYQRLVEVARERPKLVAQQEIDNLHAKESAMAGALGAAQRKVQEAQAEQSRFRTLLAYASITAPYDGVITKRFVDPGALIEAGTSSSQALPLFELAQESLLRLRFPVPESAAPLVHIGETVEFRVSSLDEKTQGKIVRFADKVDRSTRTMVTEVDVPNPDGHFRPGMYAYVTLPLHENKSALAIPVQALSVGDHPTVLVVNEEGVVELRPVTIGIQTPDQVEIKSGVKDGDLVIIGSHSGIHPDLKVNAKLTDAPKSY
jgi:RND family efflux transporter MFP subunit